MNTVSTILADMERGKYSQPPFQRRWVWNRSAVKSFMQSLYHRYPAGGLILWPTKDHRGADTEGVIDGQQRLTALYGVLRGERPAWFKGDGSPLDGLMFDLEHEKFDYQTAERIRDIHWVDVTKLFTEGVDWWLKEVGSSDLPLDVQVSYQERTMKLMNISNFNVPVHALPANTGIREAAHIFQIVNSAGTRVRKGELVLGRLNILWPEARSTIEKAQDKWKEHGLDLKIDWVLHTAAAVSSNRIEFDVLEDITNRQTLRDTIGDTIKGTDALVNLLQDRLGIDHKRAMAPNLGLAPIVVFLNDEQSGDRTAQENTLLGWWLYGSLHQRWSTTTDARTNEDLAALQQGGTEGLVEHLQHWRSELTIRPEDLTVNSARNRFYRFFYILARRAGARDLKTGVKVRANLAGQLGGLQVHHIFPKKLLKQHRLPKEEINQMGNVCFLTQGSNLRIGAKSPAEYLSDLEKARPGVLETQWIPNNPKLWRVANYRRFLVERRKRIAGAANEMLQGLIDAS